MRRRPGSGTRARTSLPKTARAGIEAGLALLGAAGPNGTLRLVAALAMIAAAFAACTGVLTAIVFSQYSDIKWAVTVAGPVIVLMLLLSRRPATYLAAGAVIALPFVRLQISFKHVPVSPVLVLIGLGVVIANLSTVRGVERPERSRLASAGWLVALLLFPGAARGLAPAEWFVQLGMVAALAYLIGRACRLDPYGQRFIAVALGIMVVVQGLIAVDEFRTGHRFNPYGGGVATYSSGYFFSYEGVFRPVAAFSDPISLGNVLALCCPALVALACYAGYPRLLRLWFASAALVAAAAVVLTLSRMSWVGATAGLAVLLAVSPARERVRQVGLLAVGTVVVTVTAVSLAGPSLLVRFNSIFDPTGTAVPTASGDEFRQQLWRGAFDAFAAHPFFGLGFGNLQEYLVQTVGGAGLFAHAHSTYLQTLAEFGLLGAAAIAVLALTVATELGRRLRHGNRADPVARAALGSIVALAVVWTTDYTIRYTPVVACMALPFILLGTRSPAVTVAALGPTPAGPAAERLVTAQVREEVVVG